MAADELPAPCRQVEVFVYVRERGIDAPAPLGFEGTMEVCGDGISSLTLRAAREPDAPLPVTHHAHIWHWAEALLAALPALRVHCTLHREAA